MTTTPTWRRAVVDVAPAVALCVLGLVEVLMGELTGAVRAQHVAGTVLVTLALALRRRYPVLVAVAVSGVIVAVSFGGEPPDEVAALVAVAVAAFAAGAYASTGAGVLAAVTQSAAMVVAIALDPSDSSLANVVPTIVLFIGLPLLMGAAYRQRWLHVLALSERARQAEETREEQARLAVAAERRRIARELHDLVSHTVSVIAVQAEAGQQLLDREPASARAAFAAIADASRSALVELARLLRLLSADEDDRGAPARVELAPQPDLAMLDPLVGRFRAAGLPARLEIEGAARPIDKGVGLSAYQLIQESLTNSLKHSEGGEVVVRLRYGSDSLDLDVRDNGKPREGSGGTGRGLLGMWERVSLCGGSLELDVSAGFRVHARLPLRPTA
ncbi:sensor histidine kinase [Micromonospora inositola]|uniref:histidine kinase n=1 Tax=Micromonospora inositola TaxID=47865 RepID=A0A1C5J9D4_9ACTN|nr:histidine kinase [Micromonospora inositola]SCG67192.1 Signal transduction histidine kinase [Micromonospora inositola]